MDATSIFIIVFATVTAIAFKVILYKRIQKWMDQDLIKGLADGNQEKLTFLQQQYQQLVDAKVKRKHLHNQLTELSEQFEQKG